MGWEIYALLASFISVLLAALLLMLARFFDFKMLEQAAKSEFVFAISSVFVAVFLIAVINEGITIEKQIAKEMFEYTYEKVGLETLKYTETDSNGEPKKDASGNPVRTTFTDAILSAYSPIEIMIFYMRSIMDCTEILGWSAFFISWVAHLFSSFTQDIFMAYPITGWTFSGIAQTMDNVLNTIYFMELTYRVQIYVLRFMDAYALSALIPIGIILRAFPPTRGAGAYVLAFSIGLYLVYPFAYFAAVFSSPFPNLCATPQIPHPPIGEQNFQASKPHELQIWYNAFERDITPFFSKLSDFTTALATNLCCFPLIALTITMTFIQGTSGLFGANVPEVGRGLLKLI